MRRRIVGLVFVLTAAALLMLSVPLGLEVRNRIRSDERSKLARSAAITAADISVEATIGSDPIELPLTIPGGPRLAVYSAGGIRMVGDGPARLDSALSPIRAGHVADATTASELVVAVPIAVDEEVRVIVRAAQSRSIVTNAARSSLVRVGLAALLALAAATVAAVALSNKLLRPLRSLHTMAHRIGTADSHRPQSNRSSGIAEFDAIANALESSAARVDQSLTRERAFSADVSHQLRTPLTGLRLALENEIEQPQVDHLIALRHALTDVDRLTATVESLLSLARDTSDHLGVVDCVPTVTERVAAARRRFNEEGRNVHFRADGPMRVRATTAAINEIVDVLLSNAQQHATGAVTVRVEHRANHVVVSVQDEGPGISMPAAVFVRRDVHATGTGIGLALGRRLAQAEGGDLMLTHHDSFSRFELILNADVGSTN